MEGEGTPCHHHPRMWTLTRSTLPQRPAPRRSYNPMLHPGRRHRPSRAPFPTQLLSELHVFIVTVCCPWLPYFISGTAHVVPSRAG